MEKKRKYTYKELQNNADYFSRAWKLGDDCLSEIWDNVFDKDYPVCDTGSFWDVAPIISERVIKKFRQLKREILITEFFVFGGFILGFILGAIIF